MIVRRFALAAVFLLLAGDAPRVVAPAEPVGEYYHGDGLGENMTLTLAADGRFTYSWDGCLGNYDSQSGTWHAEGDTVSLTVLTSSAAAADDALPRQLRMVHWGARLYLVAPAELVAFVNDVNAGLEPRKDAYGSSYLRREDWNLGTAGAPDIGDAALALLLSAPIRGSIVQATDRRTIRVDVGARHGLRVGMKLYYQGLDAFAEYRLVTVADVSAEAVLDPDIGDATPGRGPVSTLLYDESLQ